MRHRNGHSPCSSPTDAFLCAISQSLSADLRPSLGVLLGHSVILESGPSTAPEEVRSMGHQLRQKVQGLARQMQLLARAAELAGRPLDPLPTDLFALARSILTQTGGPGLVRLEPHAPGEFVLLDSGVVGFAWRAYIEAVCARRVGSQAELQFEVRSSPNQLVLDLSCGDAQPADTRPGPTGLFLDASAFLRGGGEQDSIELLLGLTLARSLILRHGGELELWGRPEGGSGLHVRLPAQEAATRPGAEAGVPGTKRESSSLARRTAQVSELRAKLEGEVARRKELGAALLASERSQAALQANAQATEKSLRLLSHRLLLAQEEERVRIRRELDGTVGRALREIDARLAQVQSDPDPDAQERQEAIASIRERVAESLSVVHDFSRGLRPAMLDELGLAPALHSHAQDFAQRTGLQLRFSGSTDSEPLDALRSTALFRVAQEALDNVARHARASAIDVVLRPVPGAVHLEVKDDGRSFDVERARNSSKGRHLGLLGMQERMEMIGGSLIIESTQGEGTTVRAQVPLPARPHSNGSSLAGRAEPR